MSEEKLTIFFDPPKRDHVCNDDISLYGFDDGTTTTNIELAKQKGARWGSVACSICGNTVMEKSLMEGVGISLIDELKEEVCR